MADSVTALSMRPPSPDVDDLLSSSPHTLHRLVRARQSEYLQPHRIRVKLGSWNVAACPGTDKDLASWFVDGEDIGTRLAELDLRHSPAADNTDEGQTGHGGVRLVGGDKIGLYVLGLQEVVDLSTTTLMRGVYSLDTGPMQKWTAALEAALPKGYELVAREQMTGLLSLIYASPELMATISNVSTVSIGTGLLGYMGNKGAISTRFVLGESTKMVFVNCHLASGSGPTQLERRIWDVGQILSRTVFDPVTFAGVSEDEGDKLGDEDIAFWFGDLNFRLDGLPGADIRRLLMLHARGEYDVSRKAPGAENEIVLVDKSSGNGADEAIDMDLTSSRPSSADSDEDFLPDPHDDPASLQATLDSLFPHDQLQRLMRQHKIFHEGWQEGPINFLPSYKYDVGTVGLFDSSEKQRTPSWCDRILYRTRKDKEAFEAKIKQREESHQRAEELKAQGILGDEEGDNNSELLFDYNPETDGEEATPEGVAGLDYDEYSDDDGAEEVEQVIVGADFHESIQLELYTSHQRISSSDHKPVVGVFIVDYEAVLPELKARVHTEIARELDRVENEGRPGVTIVVDPQDHGDDRSDVKTGEDAAPVPGSEVAVDFGQVRVLRSQSASLTLANTGRASATVWFVERAAADEHPTDKFPEWIETCFARSDMAANEGSDVVDLGRKITLEPGETVKAIVSLVIDGIPHARALNAGDTTLEDVLVLRVDKGRDYFIPVRATWMPTCISRSIDELIRVPNSGLTAFCGSHVGKGLIPSHFDVQSAAPQELLKLTVALESVAARVLADAQMLEDCKIPGDAGWPFDDKARQFKDEETRKWHMARLVEALDQNNPILETFPVETSSMERMEAVGETLIFFLKSLTDGVVSEPLWQRIEEAALPSLVQRSGVQSPEDDKAAILDILQAAPYHNISFVFLTTSLAKIISELTPLSSKELGSLKAAAPARGGLGLNHRSLSFKRNDPSVSADVMAACEKRQLRQKRYADIFAPAVCRAPVLDREKERKALVGRQRSMLEVFLQPNQET